MKIIGVIPARYQSSRFPGKPLADIDGKPMVWWVYKKVACIKQFSEVYIATDNNKIAEVCEKLLMPYIMTDSDTPNHIHRIWEVSEKIMSDYYISINGDEPLIRPENINRLIENLKIVKEPYFKSVYRNMTDPTEVLDISNVKIVLDKNGCCLYQSRNPIPSTKGSLLFQYKKAIGIECFNKLALDFFVSTPMGCLEQIEDIDHLRFLEHAVPIHYVQVESDSISVDTEKDLQKVRMIMGDNRDA